MKTRLLKILFKYNLARLGRLSSTAVSRIGLPSTFKRRGVHALLASGVVGAFWSAVPQWHPWNDAPLKGDRTLVFNDTDDKGHETVTIAKVEFLSPHHGRFTTLTGKHLVRDFDYDYKDQALLMWYRASRDGTTGAVFFSMSGSADLLRGVYASPEPENGGQMAVGVCILGTSNNTNDLLAKFHDALEQHLYTPNLSVALAPE